MLTELNQKLKLYRISPAEYELMKTRLGREPKPVEWPLFSALWSEHCSYKSSKIHLRKFAYRNQMTPDMDGENAGVVDLGFGERIAFKMESHNHPSFIEPVQGAATGVGGILRDIFTMGARPILSANYLCFGEIQADRMKSLMTGVVKGISSYGNCVGVPTTTGQTNFDPSYNKNILVNALNVGYFGPDQKMALSKAQGVGNLVVYVGAKTGRDGVHGASMASASFDNDSESKKPNVQIGDPFYEKLLIEACLEVLEKNLVVAMQDMGAAGLTSSSFEMASKGQIGLEIDLKKVPLRDSSMTAEEILLSESQERMLLICEEKNFEVLFQTFKKWGLDASVLGKVILEKVMHLKWGPEDLTKIDPDLIVEGAPRYERPYSNWSSLRRVETLSSRQITVDELVKAALSSGDLNHHTWIHRQYDQRVGARTAAGCDQAVSFVRLDHSLRGLSCAVGCRPQLMKMDARIGALDAVYYPAFQMALKGAKALAVTDCLNFGNPTKPEIMSEFVASVEAIAEAAKNIDAPVISGNVSFYNETLDQNILSTPATGVVGLRSDVEDLVPDQFQNAFESLALVRFDWVKTWAFVDQLAERNPNSKILTASEKYQFTENTSAPIAKFIKQCLLLDGLKKQKKLQYSAIKSVGLGGAILTCLKMATTQIGFNTSYDEKGLPPFELLKDQLYSFVISTKDFNGLKSELEKVFQGLSVDVIKIGETTQGQIQFENVTTTTQNWAEVISKGLT